MPNDPTRDAFGGWAASPSSGGRKVAEVTPSDSQDLEFYAKALRIEGAGDLTFLPVDNSDDAPITWAVEAGDVIDFVQVRRVLDSGTTATGIYAVWG